MLRTLGFPSRVAIGYTPGQRDPDTGVYHVTTSELHSWVEVLFPTYGWLAFEPTPGRTNPVANEYQHPPSPAPPGRRDAPPRPVAAARRCRARPAITSELPRQLQNLSRRELPSGLALTPLPSAPTERPEHARAGREASILLAVRRWASWWRWRSRPSARCGAELGCASRAMSRAR